MARENECMHVRSERSLVPNPNLMLDFSVLLFWGRGEGRKQA